MFGFMVCNFHFKSSKNVLKKYGEGEGGVTSLPTLPEEPSLWRPPCIRISWLIPGQGNSCILQNCTSPAEEILHITS